MRNQKKEAGHAGSQGSQTGQGARLASLASATRLKYNRSASGMRLTQPHSRPWKSRAPRCATYASPSGTATATAGSDPLTDSATAPVSVVAVVDTAGVGSYEDVGS